MKALLPHYERELAFLRSHAGDFAKAYPKIAGRLMPSGDVGEDPHVERLIEGFALLASRIHKRLDDDFPLFTESLLEVLYPHYLRPLPSCAIAQFDLGVGATQLTQAATLPRASMLSSRPVRGAPCRFRTTYPLALAPVALVSAAFHGALQAPAGTAVPRGATAVISLEFALQSPQARWSALGVDALRVYLDGEASQVVALREALLGRVRGVLVQQAAHGPWRSVEALPREVGFAEDEALIDADARSHPAYRLLTEYFAFPEKFNFVDLPLPKALDDTSRSLTLHFALAGLRSDADEARLLETLSARNLQLGCTPVVNLFTQRAEPIKLTHRSETYPVLPDARRAWAFEVHSIDKVWRVRQSAGGEESIVEFRPFYSLQHDDLLDEGAAAGRYWYAQRNEQVAELSPGFETELAIVDIDFDPALPQADTLAVDVMATHRDLPAQLAINQPGGDLFHETGGPAKEIRLLRRPTPSMRFERGHGALWRLISHLSLNHLSLSAGGIDALKETLRLYDLPRSAMNRRVLDALVAIEHRSATACLPGEPFPSFVRGVEVRLTVDEQHFVGSGLRLFAQVLDHFFGLYVHANSFTQLKLISARTQEELVACPRRAGSSPLL